MYSACRLAFIEDYLLHKYYTHPAIYRTVVTSADSGGVFLRFRMDCCLGGCAVARRADNVTQTDRPAQTQRSSAVSCLQCGLQTGLVQMTSQPDAREPYRLVLVTVACTIIKLVDVYIEMILSWTLILKIIVRFCNKRAAWNAPVARLGLSCK
ncbi:hypothetical protein J6590_050891 [Homalodisca vitripennis]|nr:hypothetical protein J6590_050891 [Homalodisca vitripennis]